ncbi:MAG: hypothetical protein U5L04_07175 [Trueperaceae bacterium]|nr:hypothetical protein [Trueperaceae bacterium]
MDDPEQTKNWQTRFLIIWIGQAFSLVGSALVRFALIWWLTEQTQSARVLTTATLVSMLPFIGLAPFSGAPGRSLESPLGDGHLGRAHRHPDRRACNFVLAGIGSGLARLSDPFLALQSAVSSSPPPCRHPPR